MKTTQKFIERKSLEKSFNLSKINDRALMTRNLWTTPHHHHSLTLNALK